MIRNPNEYRYQKTVQAVGIALLCFLLFSNLGGAVLFLLRRFVLGELQSDVLAEVFYQSVYALIYFLSFALPVGIFKRRMRKKGLEVLPMRCRAEISPSFFAILFTGILIIWAFSDLNAKIVGFFDFSAATDNLFFEEPAYEEGYEIVLQFIVICVVPAFCEELLFRGCILENLLPFGKGGAVLTSGLLFALMHQNPEQFLYTFVAGIVIGAVYVKTGNVWNCIFLHFLNNFFSFAREILVDRFDVTSALFLWGVIDLVIFLCGMLCLPLFVRLLEKKTPVWENGVFEKSFPPDEDYIASPVAAERKISLFLNFPMTLYCTFCILEMLLLFGLAVFS